MNELSAIVTNPLQKPNTPEDPLIAGTGNPSSNPLSNLTAVHFDVFTLFPQMFVSPLGESIIRRALENRLITIALHNIRDYTTDRHHICDDTPYGGGGGMIMKPEPLVRAVETVLTHPAGWELASSDVGETLPAWDQEVGSQQLAETPIILLTPQGRQLTQRVVAELQAYPRLAFICGRYEGVDERVRTQLVTDEISIGDYVLSGGELAAMVVIDAVTRLIPGALGDALGAHRDSHSPGKQGLLEGPQYTRPHTFRNESVPDILLSGHHAKMEAWHHEQSLLRTLARRPDLLEQYPLTAADRTFLHHHGWQPQADETN